MLSRRRNQQRAFQPQSVLGNYLNVSMNYTNINAINGMADSTLTIHGDVSGNFQFAADVSNTAADKLIIEGDLAEGSSIGMLLNATEQMSGDMSFTTVAVNGENGAGAPELLGVTGAFADTALATSIGFDENGHTVVNVTFGMGHLSTSAMSATMMAQNWWMQAIGSTERRHSRTLAGNGREGFSFWDQRVPRRRLH